MDLPKANPEELNVERGEPQREPSAGERIMAKLRLFDPFLLVENIQKHQQRKENLERWQNRPRGPGSRRLDSMVEMIRRSVENPERHAPPVILEWKRRIEK